MTVHNYRSRQVNETLNRVNPSSSFRDVRSAKSGPNLWQIWQVFGPGVRPYGANGQITMTVHNYRSRQVHETLNRVNPSSSFRDVSSAKSGPNLWQIWQVFGPWASPYGANGHMTIAVHTYRPRQFHRTSNGENPLSGCRDMGSASLAAARPPARPPGPWRQYPSSPEGWGVKRCHRQTDRRTDRQTEIAILKAAWSQLKIYFHHNSNDKKINYHLTINTEMEQLLQWQLCHGLGCIRGCAPPMSFPFQCMSLSGILCNDVSHWLGANLESALGISYYHYSHDSPTKYC